MSSEANDEIAARWLVKRERGVWTPEDEDRFTAWLDASTANRVAYFRLYATWDKAAKLKALGAGIAPGTVPKRGRWGSIGFFKRAVPEVRALSIVLRRVHISRALAAIFIVFAIGIYALGAGLFAGHRYSTSTGAIDTVALNDGSQITLNSDSQIRVDLRESERRIALNKGEAFFEVAKDSTRPFVVEVGNKRVIAVGTQFSVRREGDEIQVVVTEGKVRIEQASVLASLIGHSESSREVLVPAGTVARTSKSQFVVRAEANVEVQKLLSWRSGYVNFDDVSLAGAVAEFNRYNTRKIVIEDPSIASIRLSGNFRTNNTEAFLWLLQNRFPIAVQRTTNEIALKAR
jgi:transmembrane sensor